MAAANIILQQYRIWKLTLCNWQHTEKDSEVSVRMCILSCSHKDGHRGTSRHFGAPWAQVNNSLDTINNCNPQHIPGPPLSCSKCSERYKVNKDCIYCSIIVLHDIVWLFCSFSCHSVYRFNLPSLLKLFFSLIIAHHIYKNLSRESSYTHRQLFPACVQGQHSCLSCFVFWDSGNTLFNL